MFTGILETYAASWTYSVPTGLHPPNMRAAVDSEKPLEEVTWTGLRFREAKRDPVTFVSAVGIGTL